jgi:hypothetical protein
MYRKTAMHCVEVSDLAVKEDTKYVMTHDAVSS